MFKSLSSKIIAATTLLVVMCSIAFLMLNIKEHENTLQLTLTKHANSLSNILSHALVPMLADESERINIATKLLDLEEYDHVQYAIVFDQNWNLIQQYISPQYMKTLTSIDSIPSFDVENLAFGVDIIRGDIIALKPIGDTQYLLGYLLLVNSYQSVMEEANTKLMLSLLPFSLFILGFMICAGIWINQKLISPLKRLATFTESITSSGGNRRFDYQGHDEVANLSNNINDMLTRIENQSIQSQHYTDTLESRKMELERMANYDSLTNLPNRKRFLEAIDIELARAKRRGSNAMVLFLDLDHFKSINDSLGHGAGDQLLIQVSRIINEQLREEDVLARLGGDEFLVLLSDVSDEIIHVAIKIAERIIEAIEKPILLKDIHVQTGVSIGIADALSSNYDSENLISNADMAMYKAKNTGRNTYAIFRPQLQAVSMRRMVIANALVTAVKNNEFEIFYQAKVNEFGQVNGLEALIRWNSALEGFISPAEFIPVAENSGKITLITRWVIEQVFKDMENIQNQTLYPIVISLNVSAYDIYDLKLIAFIKEKIEVYNIDASMIEIEVTESAYLNNFDEADHFFTEIRNLGISIALDDFGTGYSSMSYLTRISINTIKIDQEFVKNMTTSSKDRLIIGAIIDLAHKLNLKICAEGVETIEQRDYLIEQGCHQIQGYFYAKPCPISKLITNIKNINDLSENSKPA